MSERYRWSGVTGREDPRAGMVTLGDDGLPDWVFVHWRDGWRELTVCRGQRPVPPRHGDEGQCGGIARHPDNGRRIWWAETAAPATAPPPDHQTTRRASSPGRPGGKEER